MRLFADPMVGPPIGFYLLTSSLDVSVERRVEIEERLRSAFQSAGWNLGFM